MKFAIALLLVGCGSKSEGNWAAARADYCDEVDLLRSEVDTALGDWSKRFAEIPAKPAADQLGYCVDAKTNLDRLAAMMQGFQRGATVLGHGRGDKSIEAAGLALDFGGTTLSRAITDVQCREGSPYAQYAQAIATVKTEVIGKLDGAIKNCTAVGWKSALQPAAK